MARGTALCRRLAQQIGQQARGLQTSSAAAFTSARPGEEVLDVKPPTGPKGQLEVGPWHWDAQPAGGRAWGLSGCPQVPPRLLMGPGPANAHPRVLAAQTLPLLGHMHPPFMKVRRHSLAASLPPCCRAVLTVASMRRSWTVSSPALGAGPGAACASRCSRDSCAALQRSRRACAMCSRQRARPSSWPAAQGTPAWRPA